MKFPVCVSVLVFGLFAAPLSAEQALDLEDETVRINYSLGYQIGGDFKRQEVEMDADAVVQGIRDALTNAKPKMSQARMRATLVELKRKVVKNQRKRSVENELKFLREGEEFLAQNAKKDGVKITDSGLQYRVIEAGSGKKPGPEDRVTVHYRGTLIDGKTFDSSYKNDKPATFAVNRVIKGWSEGLQLMNEGAKYQFFIPQDLAYGTRGPLAHRTLLFEVELLSVDDPAPDSMKHMPKAGSAKRGG